MLRSHFYWMALLAGTAAVAAACAINPQPLPPDTYEASDAGTATVGVGDNSGSANPDGSLASTPTAGDDASTTTGIGGDADSGAFVGDGSVGDTDAGDGGDAGDADAGDGGEEADASDASRDH